MNILQIILAFIGVWQIVIALLTNTKDNKSAFIFKIIPFFMGCYCIFYSVLSSGIIKIS